MTEKRRLNRILAQRTKLRAVLAALKSIWEGSPTYGTGAVLEALRRLDRLAQRDAKLRAELAALKSIWEGSPNYGKGALLEALRRLDRILAQRDAELRAELAALKSIWEGSPNYGKGALLEALRLCTGKGVRLPFWLARAVHAELICRVPKQALKHYQRWREVRRMRDTRPVTPETAKLRPGRRYSLAEPIPVKEIGYEETVESTAELLKKTSAAGSTKAIRRSYGLVENDLPKSERYKRTYAKRTR